MVFANPKVVDRINQHFIPVALKAGQVNNPPPGIEGDLYAEIARSRPAPQGICTVNSDGKVLAWVLSFENENSILRFFDHVQDRYAQSTPAASPVPAERFRVFPTVKLDDVPDNGRRIPIPAAHGADERCPGQASLQTGTLVGRLIGRALDKNGQPLADTTRQEHYMESRVQIPPAAQEALVESALAGNATFSLPYEFVRQLVDPAFLGQLDVNPSGVIAGSENRRRVADFEGELLPADDGPTRRVQITGVSDMEGAQKAGPNPDGREWEHRVSLNWSGHADIDPETKRIVRLVVAASGNERLKWGNQRLRRTREPDARHLMAGHPIDFDGGVKYGLIAEPCAPDEVGEPALSGPQIVQSIQRKMQQLQTGLRQLARNGGNPQPFAERMQTFGALMQQRKFAEAEQLIDGVLTDLLRAVRQSNNRNAR